MEINLEITSLISPFINTLKAATNEWENVVEIGVEEYLHSQFEKYYLTNTFIHRAEKVKFDDVYYPLKAKYGSVITDFSDFNQVFKNYKKILLIGNAGSGKTTLMKHIFFTSVRSSKIIPIIVELRIFNEYSGKLEDFIFEKILKTKIKPSDSIMKRALRSGAFIFLFDGYDEIFSRRKVDIMNQIDLFIDNYSKNNFLVTTRPGSGLESFPGLYNFYICSLNMPEVSSFIEKVIKENERIYRLIEIINDPLNKNYIEYLSSPLLLSMFIVVFESHPELPSKRSLFYRNVFDTLYSKHDGINKNSFPREKLTKLQRDNFEDILGIFSYISLLKGDFSFTQDRLEYYLKIVRKNTSYTFEIDDIIYDLRTGISIIILDGFIYNFPHRSMQEYFAAEFISSLPTAKKEIIYNNLKKSFIHKSSDNSFNLWNLCYELDKTNFLKYVILPELKTYDEALNKNLDSKMIEGFLLISNAVIKFSDSRDYSGNKFFLKIERKSDFFSSTTNFIGIKDLDISWKFEINSRFEDELMDVFGLGPEEFTIAQIPKNKIDALSRFLTYLPINDIVMNFKNEIISNIVNIESIVEREDGFIDGILDF